MGAVEIYIIQTYSFAILTWVRHFFIFEATAAIEVPIYIRTRIRYLIRNSVSLRRCS